MGGREDLDCLHRYGRQEHSGRLDVGRDPGKTTTSGTCEGRQGITPRASFPESQNSNALSKRCPVFSCAQEIRHQFSRMRIRPLRSSTAGSDRKLPETRSRQAGVRKAHVQRGSNPRTKTMAGPHPSRHQCRNVSPTWLLPSVVEGSKFSSLPVLEETDSA